MAFIPVPNVAQAQVIGRLFGQVVQNTVYFALPESWIASEVAQLAASVGEWAVTELLANLSEDYSYLRTETKSLETEASPVYTDATGVGSVGVGTASMPGNVCLVVSFRTALGGRSFRGRNYLSGLPQSGVTGNQYNNIPADALVAAYNALPGMVVDDLPDAIWSVVSRYHLGLPRVSGIYTPVTSAIITNYDLDSQRRRLAGRGV